MTNTEIIMNEAMMIGFEYDGGNILTFAEWQEIGYKIIKGQKALIKTRLWKPVTTTDKETGKQEKKFILVNANLFSAEQVEPMSDKFKNFLETKRVAVTA